MQAEKQVDSLRFLDRTTKMMVNSWIGMETPDDIPWSPMAKSLEESTIAIVSSSGLALKSDKPFDQEGERQNPWWGDPSYRIIPRDATAADVNLYHLHIHPRVVEQDLNTLFPLERLLEFEESGEIGRSAARHYSYMGYILQPDDLLNDSVPEIIHHLQEDEVDLVLLVPG